ncbi:MAG: adenylyltransferase/cytidyltransferase family protein [Myxococcota bacterium]
MKPIRARDKILRLEVLVRRVAAARARGERIVFTNGCFDLLHRGHLRGLEQARALGDRLIVAVNGDASVRRAKGADRPIRSAARRRELVAGLACVDWVVGFGADTPLRLIERLQPDVLAKGGDWALDAIVGSETVLARGGRVVRLARVPDEGTTGELARIRGRASRPVARERAAHGRSTPAPGAAKRGARRTGARKTGEGESIRRSARRRDAAARPPRAPGGTRDRATRRSARSRGRRRP